MAPNADNVFVGFGFGAVQAGLFLHEAFRSGHFRRLVVAEILPDLVEQVRSAGGFYSVNIAYDDHVETVRVGPIEVCNPVEATDRERLVEAIAAAHEIATAVPNVDLYAAPGAQSLHRVLALGLARKLADPAMPACVVYTAENRNDAAEVLERLVRAELAEGDRERLGGRVQFLNTVIGKMSGFVPHPALHGLAPVTPQGPRAFLVESFNSILVSRITLPGFRRGIDVFVEKDDLIPFEEAKLYGHNATHALAAYLGQLLGVRLVADLRSAPGMLLFLRDAFTRESGEALVRKRRGVDRLFTAAGYREYADDLLRRMTNPYLLDTVERVTRDPLRKLGWNDRLVGTIRVALEQGIQPARYAIGAAAAIAALHDGFLDGRSPGAQVMQAVWNKDRPNPAEREIVLALIEDGRRFLHEWRRFRFPDVAEFFREHTGAQKGPR